MKKQRGWMVRVTTRHGDDMYLRRGAKPGIGPIVRFTSKLTADVHVDLIRPGLDDGEVASVVPYDNSCE